MKYKRFVCAFLILQFCDAVRHSPFNCVKSSLKKCISDYNTQCVNLKVENIRLNLQLYKARSLNNELKKYLKNQQSKKK